MDYRVFLAAPLAALVLSVGAAELRMPHGWQPSKKPIPANPLFSTKADYEVGLDPSDGAPGLRSLTVKSVGALSTDYGSVGAAQQVIHGHAGQRLRFCGQIRSEGARTWAGLFLGEGDESPLGGEPEGQKPLPMGAGVAAPDSDWQDVCVVAQLPDDIRPAVLGLALVGEGQVWARRLRFEVVGPEVPLTRTPVGIDRVKLRDLMSRHVRMMSSLPPSLLVNATLD